MASTQVGRQVQGRDIRKSNEKIFRQAMVSRFNDKLTELDSDRNAFRRHLGKAKQNRSSNKINRNSHMRTVNFADLVTRCSPDNGLDTDKSNAREDSSISTSDLSDNMTQGALSNRLNSLSSLGLLSQIGDRVQSASGNRRGLNLERERTFPGRKPKTRHSTALINWATAMASKGGLRDGDEGSLDSDPAMNFLMRRYAMPDDEFTRQARFQAREKISSSLSLPIADRLSRIATLKQNVQFIEGKFRSLLYKQRANESREEIKSAASGEAPEEYWPSRFMKQGEAIDFFRRRGRVVIICKRWINMVMDMNKNSTWEKELKTFVDLAMDMEDNCVSPVPQPENGPTFDKNEFKANKEISLSMDVKTILSTRPEARTPEMIKQVMLGLQTLQSLGEYPLDTQEQLCRVAWFQQVPARKYIIRQGHKPEAFYFILSGLAVVKKIEKDEATGEEHTRVVARLTRGQSFGELGLIFKTPRNATVESGTHMELLVVGKQDFLKIFMNNVKPGEDPDHIAFLKQQPVLKFWPFDALKADPSACLINYFKRGSLITENGKTSEWIYFIKSGSCEALKRLKAVTPRTEKELRKNKLNKAKDPHILEISSKIVTTPRKQQKQSVHPELLRSMTEYYDNVRTSAEEDVQTDRKKRKSLSGSTRKSATATPTSLSQRQSLTIPEIIEPPSSSSVAQVYLKRTPPTEDLTLFPLPPIPARQSEGPGVSQSKFCQLNKCLKKGHFTVPTLANLSTTYTEKEMCDSDTVHSNRDEREEVFVTVEKLQSRDIFGMNTLSFSEDEDETQNIPEVSLVSKGAEIVMLSKKVFLKHANERVKLVVQELITPYPGETQLQENLQIQSDWKVYRQQVLSDVMFVNYAFRNSLSGVV